MPSPCTQRYTVKGVAKEGVPQSNQREKKLTEYLQFISGLDHYIAPYALGLGGRTWLLSEGTDRQYVDFLGAWKTPEASARYYRAAPQAVLVSLQRFYSSTIKTGVIRGKGAAYFFTKN